MKKLKKSVVLLIPYFGTLPDYFDLWLRSAESNPEFDFFIYTDAQINVRTNSNIKIFQTSFEAFRERFYQKLGRNIKLNTPYKLCDYKPAYGYVLEKNIRGFDFWGFCDIDLILGNVSRFITPDKLDTYDKLYSHGHFCLMKNTDKMNALFLERYDRVLDHKYAFSTNYCCHFDENGTIFWAGEQDASLRVYKAWDFADTPYDSYELKCGGRCCAVWYNGNLILMRPDGTRKDIMYIHLQKRKMKKCADLFDKAVLIIRDEFHSCQSADDFLIPEYDQKSEMAFDERVKEIRREMVFKNISDGALRFRINAAVKRWKKW